MVSGAAGGPPGHQPRCLSRLKSCSLLSLHTNMGDFGVSYNLHTEASGASDRYPPLAVCPQAPHPHRLLTELKRLLSNLPPLSGSPSHPARRPPLFSHPLAPYHPQPCPSCPFTLCLVPSSVSPEPRLRAHPLSPPPCLQPAHSCSSSHRPQTRPPSCSEPSPGPPNTPRPSAVGTTLHFPA